MKESSQSTGIRFEYSDSELSVIYVIESSVFMNFDVLRIIQRVGN